MDKKKVKKAKTYKGKSLKLGGGGKFKKLTDELVSEGKSEDAAAGIAASIGRKKYGKKKMTEWSSQGKKRSK